MAYTQFELMLSVPRLAKYKRACGYDEKKAMALYRANIALSQELYAVIGLFEVVLRNSLDAHFIKRKGEAWLEDAVAEGGYLDIADCENAFHSVHEAIYRLGAKYAHDGLIAALTLGFWTNVFGKKDYPASGNTALAVFPNRPAKTKYKDIFSSLQKINILRNRIAHHEPICFDVFGAISTAMPMKRFTMVKDLIHWMGYSPGLLFQEVEDVVAQIEQINRLSAEQR